VWVASTRRSNRTLFGLTTLAPGASPAYADATNATADLSDCFNFNQTPLTFQTVPARLGAKYFLEDRSPPTDLMTTKGLKALD